MVRVMKPERVIVVKIFDELWYRTVISGKNLFLYISGDRVDFIGEYLHSEWQR
ncbi:hypothetical protein TMEN_7024 [Trichophyton mentagrophytes]|nr:hypothetical protein TMEN_7024 [Trichophyton mentagrophytes]